MGWKRPMRSGFHAAGRSVLNHSNHGRGNGQDEAPQAQRAAGRVGACLPANESAGRCPGRLPKKCRHQVKPGDRDSDPAFPPRCDAAVPVIPPTRRSEGAVCLGSPPATKHLPENIPTDATSQRGGGKPDLSPSYSRFSGRSFNKTAFFGKNSDESASGTDETRCGGCFGRANRLTGRADCEKTLCGFLQFIPP